MESLHSITVHKGELKTLFFLTVPFANGRQFLSLPYSKGPAKQRNMFYRFAWLKVSFITTLRSETTSVARFTTSFIMITV